MLLELPIVWIVTLNALGWPIIQLGLAWAWTRLPLNCLHPPRALGFETGGHFYDRSFAIRRWKDRLPDGASWLGGGFSKAKLQQRSPEYIQRFMVETWRGELCHWCALAFIPLFALWNPWWANGIIVAYALAANLPCILVQRYNRARMQATLERF
jgi:glycosyl-4,4'-diaponeurosporenoate acyltransferase